MGMGRGMGMGTGMRARARDEGPSPICSESSDHQSFPRGYTVFGRAGLASLRVLVEF